MFGTQSILQYSPPRFAPEIRACVSFPQHTPKQNHLLAALPPADYERLLLDLEPIVLPRGWTVQGADDRRRYLYFITAGIVSRFYVTQTGASAAFGVTGNEGVIGVASFLGGASMPSQAVVVSPGHAYRLRASLLDSELQHDSALLHALLRYTMAMIAQTAQIAVCNRHHTLDQQLCRWLLSCIDRLPTNSLAVTQELIASMLGGRRESVTISARKLREAGLIQYSRGHIAVLDRPRLEAQACECYAVIKREYDRLLPQDRQYGMRPGVRGGVDGRATYVS